RRSASCARASCLPETVARIAVAATAPFGADVLERLAAEHDVALLVTRPDKPRGRGRKVAAPAAKETARRPGIPVAQPARPDASAVYARAAEIAARLIRDVLPEPDLREQPSDGATYAEKITAADRELDLTRPAREVVDHVRALSPHIGARAVIDGSPLVVWKA